MATPPMVGGGMAPGPFPGPQAAAAAREVNTASLCRIGQETVQDIVCRTMEIFQLLRNMQLPNGVTYHTGTYQDRLGKLQEHLRQLSILFRKLRLVYDKCIENCAGLDPIPIEQLVPYIEEDGAKHDDRGIMSQLRFATEERKEILEVNKGYFKDLSGAVLPFHRIYNDLYRKTSSTTIAIGFRTLTKELAHFLYMDKVKWKLKQKNQQLKQIMDQLRNLIWDINAMLAMRN